MMVKVSVWVPVRVASVAESVIVVMPSVVGVPETTPVVESMLKPGGRALAVNRAGALINVIA